MLRKVLRITVLAMITLLTSTAALSQGNNVQVYHLRHQTADALLPAINSILRRDESVNAYNNELVVNASPDTHAQVQSLLQQLDYAPRSLMISVRNNSDGGSITDSSGVSGGIRTGKVYLGAGRPVVTDGGLVIRQDGLQVHSNRTQTNTTSESSQQVRAIEGHPAWISAGQTAPVRSYDRYGYPTTDYVEANQGFYVTARLIGNRVQLAISASNDRFTTDDRFTTNDKSAHRDTYRNTRQPVIETQQVNTTVSGSIGEWIELGTIQTDSNNRNSTYTSRERTSGGSITGIAVRVVPAD